MRKLKQKLSFKSQSNPRKTEFIKKQMGIQLSKYSKAKIYKSNMNKINF